VSFRAFVVIPAQAGIYLSLLDAGREPRWQSKSGMTAVARPGILDGYGFGELSGWADCA